MSIFYHNIPDTRTNSYSARWSAWFLLAAFMPHLGRVLSQLFLLSLADSSWGVVVGLIELDPRP
jgi:hypothetical protein